MALTPWQAISRLSCDEIASALAGFEISVKRNRTFVVPFADEISVREYDEWRRVLALAVERGELRSVSGWEVIPDLEPDDDDENKPNPILLALVMEATFERNEVYRWLKSIRARDEDIPESLKIFPAANKEEKGDELHPRREQTYHLIIASLLAMQYGDREIKQPYVVADTVLDDCQRQGIKAPASRNTLGELFEKLPPVQEAPLD